MSYILTDTSLTLTTHRVSPFTFLFFVYHVYDKVLTNKFIERKKKKM